MGQYYRIVNLDKREYIKPHDFAEGAKLLEFGCDGGSTMTALAILLADGNGRGGGDLKSDDPIIGSWAGDRIVIAGDYADPGKWGIESGLYYYAEAEFANISQRVITAMMDDMYLRKVLIKNGVEEPMVKALEEEK